MEERSWSKILNLRFVPEVENSVAIPAWGSGRDIVSINWRVRELSRGADLNKGQVELVNARFLFPEWNLVWRDLDSYTNIKIPNFCLTVSTSQWQWITSDIPTHLVVDLPVGFSIGPESASLKLEPRYTVATKRQI